MRNGIFCLFLVCSCSHVLAQDYLGSWPQAYGNWLKETQTTSKGMAWVFYAPLVRDSASAWRIRMAEADAASLANDLVAAYQSDQANERMAGFALAVLERYGHISKNKWPNKTVNPDASGLVAYTQSIVIALASQPRIAAEFLLQLQAEGLGTLHMVSGQGNPTKHTLPREVTALALSFLTAADPLTRALAEWTIAIVVGQDNDKFSPSGGKVVWPGNNPPDWYTAWAAIPSAEHLDLDYLRQAINLGVHRRTADLLRWSQDLLQRAEARCQWSGNAENDLAACRSALTALAQCDETTVLNDWLRWRHQLRTAILRGKDLDFRDLLYIKRHSSGSHLQPGMHDAKHHVGGDLYRQTGLDPATEPAPLINNALTNGYVADWDLWYDADRLVLSWVSNGSMSLYELTLGDGSLRQITRGFQDTYPVYLPDGRLVFGSNRSSVGITCASSLGAVPANGTDGNQHTNLFRCDADGSHIEQLSYSKDDDAYPQILNDGRIMWMRWDYQERGVNEIFSLWVMRPDGTGSDGYYRVHVLYGETYQALRDARPIPGTSLLVAAGGSHYGWREGHVVIADTSMGINNSAGMRTATPHAGPVVFGSGTSRQTVVEGGVQTIGGHYAKPMPLSEKSFLVSASWDMPASTSYALYYMDVWGNRELIHRDKLLGVMAAMPLQPREKPPILPDLTNPSVDHATLFVDNVYADLPGIDKGAVKWIRINQMLHWLRYPGTDGLQFHPIQNPTEAFGYGTCGPVRTVGIVPVAEDGSAYFQVPHDADLYFQALDAEFMSVRNMRTHVEFKAGEQRSCFGCHETKGDSVPNVRPAMASRMPPTRPIPPPWGDRVPLDFEKHINPIFERACVSCHGSINPQGGLDLSSTRDSYGYMQGYRSLYGLAPKDPTPRVLWTPDGQRIDAKGIPEPKHPWWKITFDSVLVRWSIHGEGLVTQPKEYGGCTHPFMQYLVTHADHRAYLSDDDMQMLATWFDHQIPYVDHYMIDRNKQLIPTHVEAYAPFGTSRIHTILSTEAPETER